MSQETFDRILDAINAELPRDVTANDPQLYRDMANLIEGCVTAALVDQLYYRGNPGRLVCFT